MKMRTELGMWIIIHNGKVKVYDTASEAVYYCFEMKEFEKQIAPQNCAYPVRSLVPHPKKRRVTRKWREKIDRIKTNFQLGVNGE